MFICARARACVCVCVCMCDETLKSKNQLSSLLLFLLWISRMSPQIIIFVEVVFGHNRHRTFAAFLQ